MNCTSSQDDEDVHGGCTKRRIHSHFSDSHISDLPSCIMVDILCRLPLRFILRSRCVCRWWFDLTLEPYFHDLYRDHMQYPFFLFPNIPNQLLFLDSDDCGDGNLRELTNRRKDCIIDKSNVMIENVCDGLVYLIKWNAHTPAYIWNPLTGDYLRIPSYLGRISRPRFPCFSGFGCSRTSKEFKIIAFTNQLKAKIFTLGSKGWRYIESCPYSLCHWRNCTFFNGALHWFVSADDPYCPSEMICSFDIDGEHFSSFPLPPLSRYTPEIHWSNLDVFRGCLCICVIEAKTFVADIHIWVMKEYGRKESWVIEFSLQHPMPNLWNDLGSQVLVNLLGGKIMTLYDHNYHYIYDIRDRKFNLVKKSEWYSLVKNSEWYAGCSLVACIPSFFPLMKNVADMNRVVPNKK